MVDAGEFGKQIATLVRAEAAKSVEPLAAENAALRAEIATLREAIASIPAGKDGRDGADGKDGAPGIGEPGQAGKDGTDGRDGEKGADGVSVTMDDVSPVLELAIARGLLDLERRATETLQKAIDRMPTPKDGVDGAPGRDGADGFALDDLQIDDDGDGTITLRFVRGELAREKSIRYPRGDRGVHRDGEEYRKGDGVTFAGSWWSAQKDAPQGKPGQSDDWRLCVKRGRDGKDGRDGIDKTAPVKL